MNSMVILNKYTFAESLTHSEPLYPSESALVAAVETPAVTGDDGSESGGNASKDCDIFT